MTPSQYTTARLARIGFEVVHRRADAAYFETVGTPLVRGRLFGPNDDPDAPSVILVNEAFVERYLGPADDPLTQTLVRDDWSALCAHVDQVPFLFHTTIEKNIQ